MADPLKQFVIQPIIPLEVGGIDLSFTNSSLWMSFAVILSIAFLTFSTQKKALVPGRAQLVSEQLYHFVATMIRETVGSKGREYFPLVFTIFMVVLMGNVLGLIPYSFTYTSHIIVTGALAILVFLAVIVIGIIKHGFQFFSILVPPGVPFWLFPLILPIELLSFVIRPVTLSVRLFANMMAGHLILKVFAGFSVAMASAGLAGAAFGIMPALINVAIYALELLIALIHAYVFAILSCIYLKDTIEIHH